MWTDVDLYEDDLIGLLFNWRLLNGIRGERRQRLRDFALAIVMHSFIILKLLGIACCLRTHSSGTYSSVASRFRSRASRVWRPSAYVTPQARAVTRAARA